MTDIGALRSLVDAGDLEVVPADLGLARRLHDAAVSDVQWSRRKATDADAQDMLGAVSDAWGAVIKLSSAALAVAGYRLRSVEGHHIVAIGALEALLPADRVQIARRLGRLRVPRKNAFYSAEQTVSQTDILDHLADCAALLDVIDEVIGRAKDAKRGSGSSLR